jgi:hypothetical protein
MQLLAMPAQEDENRIMRRFQQWVRERFVRHG